MSQSGDKKKYQEELTTFASGSSFMEMCSAYSKQSLSENSDCADAIEFMNKTTRRTVTFFISNIENEFLNRLLYSKITIVHSYVLLDL